MTSTTTPVPPVLTVRGYAILAARLERDELILRDHEAAGSDRTVPEEELARLRARTSELRHALPRSRPPAQVPDDPDIVEVGDEVVVEFEHGDREHLVLVHPVEAALTSDRVSIDSPLGLALLGRRIGDVVTVAAPRRDYTCTVLGRGRAT